MITLVLDAKRIPDGTKVRKVTGTSEYYLTRELNIRIPGDSRKIISEGIVFLTNERSINGFPDTTKLAIDLDEEEALELLRNLNDEAYTSQ